MMPSLPAMRAQTIAMAALSVLLTVAFVGTLRAGFSILERLLAGGGAILYALMAWSVERRRGRYTRGR